MEYGIVLVNGEIEDIDFYTPFLQKAKILVCADGGANIAYNYRIKVDSIIGDLDSIKEESFAYYEQLGVEIQKYPPEKDKTDSELAIDWLKEKGIRNIVMIGFLGSRIDHFLSNLNLLYYAKEKGMQLTLLEENNEIILLAKGENTISCQIGQTLSFASIRGDVWGITIKGCQYEVRDFHLKQGSSILTSNIATEEEVSVKIKEGSLLGIKIRNIK